MLSGITKRGISVLHCLHQSIYRAQYDEIFTQLTQLKLDGKNLQVIKIM